MKQKSEYQYKIVCRTAVTASLGLACIATPARSQDIDSQSVHELDAYSISASRFEVPIQQVGSSVDVLEGFELNKGHDIFLVDALRDVPGIVMRNNGGPGGTFGITTRGLNSNQPKVLVNGIEMSNPSNGAMFNLGNLFTGATSRVEVLRGPQSSLYGADALAGVISVDTLSFDAIQGGRAFAGYGSHDTYDYGLGYTANAGALSWSVDGMIHESEGFSSQDPAYGPAWADDDTYDNTTLTGAINYDLADTLRVYASALYIDTYSEFDPGDPAWIWGTPAGDYYSTAEQYFARIGGAFEVRDNWESSVSLGYSDIDTLSYTDGSEYFASGKRYKYEWINRVQASEGWNFVAGVEHETEENLSAVGYRDDTSVFFENVIAASRSLDVTIGARYDDNSAYGEEVTYRGTFSYRIQDTDSRIRGSYGTSFQAPTFYQLFNPTYGNTDLMAETGKGWDLGFETAFADGKLLLSAAIFGNDIEDKIDWDGVYKNLSHYQSEGIEASLRYFVSDSLRLNFTHTYSDAEEDGGLEALRVPENVSTIGVNWTGFEGKLDLNLNTLFVSSQYSDSASRAAGMKLEGYEVANLAATYDLSEQYSLWLRVGNIFDAEYEEIAGYQTDGLNFNAGVRLGF